MINDFLYSVWFFLPAGMANVSPILVYKLPVLRYWNTPLDCGLTYRGKQIFGSNKTWRGFVSGVIMAEVVFLLEQKLSTHLGSFSSYLAGMHYAQLSAMLGILLGVGVILGDALESFFKRQRGISPGNSWFPFDQLDYIIGGCLSAALIVVLPLSIYIWIFITWFVSHIVFSYIGYLLDFKEKPI